VGEKLIFDEDVVELQIAVQNAPLVNVAERPRDVPQGDDAVLTGERRIGRDLAQRRALDPVERQTEDLEPQIFEQTVAEHQRWVIEPGQGARFASHALDVGGARLRDADELQRPELIGADAILGLPNRTLSPFSDEFEQAVTVAVEARSRTELHGRGVYQCPRLGRAERRFFTSRRGRARAYTAAVPPPRAHLNPDPAQDLGLLPQVQQARSRAPVRPIQEGRAGAGPARQQPLAERRALAPAVHAAEPAPGRVIARE